MGPYPVCPKCDEDVMCRCGTPEYPTDWLAFFLGAIVPIPVLGFLIDFLR